MNNKQLSQIYNLSESSIRRIIVKQRKGNVRMKDKITRVITNWGLKNVDIKQIYNTTWQVGDDYVLKVYQSFSMLERNLKILQILDNMDIPVGKIIPTANNAVRVNALKNALTNVFLIVSTMALGIAGKIDWPIALVMAAGAWFGGYLGSFTQRKKGNKFVQHFISACSVAMAVYLIVDLIVS